MWLSEQTLDRLSRTKADAEEMAIEYGSIAGNEWGCGAAEYDQLRRIAEANREGRLSITDAEDFMEILTLESGPPDEVCDFWEDLIGDRYPSNVYVQAFAHSALDVLRDSALLES